MSKWSDWSDLRLEHEGAVEDVYQQVGGHGDDVVGVGVEKVMALVVVVTRGSDWLPGILVHIDFIR